MTDAGWDGTAVLYKCKASGFTYDTAEGPEKQCAIAASWRLMQRRVYLELDMFLSDANGRAAVWRVTNYMGIGQERQDWPWEDFQESDLFVNADPLAAILKLDAVRASTLQQASALQAVLDDWYVGKIEQTSAQQICDGMTT